MTGAIQTPSDWLLELPCLLSPPHQHFLLPLVGEALVSICWCGSRRSAVELCELWRGAEDGVSHLLFKCFLIKSLITFYFEVFELLSLTDRKWLLCCVLIGWPSWKNKGRFTLKFLYFASSFWPAVIQSNEFMVTRLSVRPSVSAVPDFWWLKYSRCKSDPDRKHKTYPQTTKTNIQKCRITGTYEHVQLQKRSPILLHGCDDTTSQQLPELCCHC